MKKTPNPPPTPPTSVNIETKKDKQTFPKFSGYQIKIVEICGTKLVDLL